MTGRILSGMAFSDYRGLDAINASALKRMRQSPLAYALYQSDGQPESSSTDATSFGTMMHDCILEPEKFSAIYEPWPGEGKLDKRTKEYKALQEKHPGKKFLGVKEYWQLFEMAASVRMHDDANQFIEGGETEATILWEVYGRSAKARLDKLHPEFVVDLKTTTAGTIHAFRNEAVKYQYFMQLAFYVDAAKAVDGVDRDAIIIMVTKRRPYEVATLRIPKKDLDQGRIQYQDALSRVAICEAEGRWPGRFQDSGIITLDMPSWAVAGEYEEG